MSRKKVEMSKKKVEMNKKGRSPFYCIYLFINQRTQIHCQPL